MQGWQSPFRGSPVSESPRALASGVAISGAGLVFGAIDSVEGLWLRYVLNDSLGELAIHPRFPQIGAFFHVAADPEVLANRVPGIRRPLPSKQSLLALAAANAAVASDPIGLDDTTLSRTAIVASSEFGSSSLVDEATTAVVTGGPRALSPLRFARTVQNAVVGDLARHFNVTGPSLALVSESPVPFAVALLMREMADVVICVGVDEIGGLVPLWAADGLLKTEPIGGGLVPVDSAGALVLRRLVDLQGVNGPWPAIVGIDTARSSKTSESTALRVSRNLGPANKMLPPPMADQDALVIAEEGVAPGRASVHHDGVSSTFDEWLASHSRATPWQILGEPFGAKPVLGIALAVCALLKTADQGLNSANHSRRVGTSTAMKQRVLVLSSDISGNAWSVVVRLAWDA